MNTTPPIPPVRRWDDRPVEVLTPEILDPYPDHPDRHPRARQRDELDPGDDWEFTITIGESPSVVDETSMVLGQMIADDVQPSTPVRLRREQPQSLPGVGRPVARWAVGLSLVSQATIGVAVSTSRTTTPVAVAAMVAVMVCCLVLIAAEHATLTSRTRRNGDNDQGKGPTDGDKSTNLVASLLARATTRRAETGPGAPSEGDPCRGAGEAGSDRATLGNTRILLPSDTAAQQGQGR